MQRFLVLCVFPITSNAKSGWVELTPIRFSVWLANTKTTEVTINWLFKFKEIFL
jgi:hypothetical protein